MMKGQNLENIKFGDSFTDDGLPGMRFDYLLANPPFGVEWKPQEKLIRDEAESLGFDGRFGAGLPRINDGSLPLPAAHDQQDEAQEGSRVAMVFNGSPLFTGDAGSGESEHPPLDHRERLARGDRGAARPALLQHRHQHLLLDRDQPQASGAAGQGAAHRRAAASFKKMRKSLGNKRNELSDEHIDEVMRIYGEFAEGEHCKVFANEDFGYRKITVERPLRLGFAVNEERLERLRAERPWQRLEEPARAAVLAMLRGIADADAAWTERLAFEAALKSAASNASLKLDAPLKKAIMTALSERDETSAVCRNAKDEPEPDPDLRDTENVPLNEDVGDYLAREVLPYVADAWVDEAKTKVGYEINFNRYFYKYVPPRPLEEIEEDIKVLEKQIIQMLGDISS